MVNIFKDKEIVREFIKRDPHFYRESSLMQISMALFWRDFAHNHALFGLVVVTNPCSKLASL